MVKVSVDNGYLRILGKSCLRIPDTWAKLSADTGYRQKAVSAPVSMDTWGSMCHPGRSPSAQHLPSTLHPACAAASACTVCSVVAKIDTYCPVYHDL